MTDNTSPDRPDTETPHVNLPSWLPQWMILLSKWLWRSATLQNLGSIGTIVIAVTAVLGYLYGADYFLKLSEKFIEFSDKLQSLNERVNETSGGID